jgi:hypothetical protein
VVATTDGNSIVNEDNSVDVPKEAEHAEDTNRLTQILDTVWNGLLLDDSRWYPEKSCFQLADDYRHSRRTPEQSVRNFIDWQTTKAGVSGFASGLPGLALMPLTAPADLVSTTYLQLRMVAVIGLLFGWDPRSDQFKTLAYMSPSRLCCRRTRP